MRIKMFTTVEDNHAFVEVKDGEMLQRYDVRKFYAGTEYDHTDEYPEWDRRAKKLIGLGYAEDVTK